MSKKRPQWYLMVRSYPKTAFVSVWLCRDDKNGQGAVMWGEVIPAAVEEIAAATGLEVIREDGKIESVKPLTVPGCVPADEQPSLFS